MLISDEGWEELLRYSKPRSTCLRRILAVIPEEFKERVFVEEVVNPDTYRTVKPVRTTLRDEGKLLEGKIIVSWLSTEPHSAGEIKSTSLLCSLAHPPELVRGGILLKVFT